MFSSSLDRSIVNHITRLACVRTLSHCSALRCCHANRYSSHLKHSLIASCASTLKKPRHVGWMIWRASSRGDAKGGCYGQHRCKSLDDHFTVCPSPICIDTFDNLSTSKTRRQTHLCGHLVNGAICVCVCGNNALCFWITSDSTCESGRSRPETAIASTWARFRNLGLT